MQYVQRILFFTILLGLASIATGCRYECKCGAVGSGSSLSVLANDGEQVTEFTAIVRFPRQDELYDPQNERMRAVTFECPHGPNPDGFVCEGNSLFEPFQQRDPSRSTGFPRYSLELGYEITVEGEGRWAGMRFEDLKQFDRIATESVDLGSRGCCGGKRERTTAHFDIVIAE